MKIYAAPINFNTPELELLVFNVSNILANIVEHEKMTIFPEVRKVDA